MIVEYDKSFEKWLSKIDDSTILKKLEKIILQNEEAKSISVVKNSKKLTGYINYYRIKL